MNVEHATSSTSLQWPGSKSEDYPKQDEENRRIRGEFGWCPSDVWSMDTYISGVMGAMIRRMIGDDVGYPAQLEPDEWTAILIEMAEGFEAWADHFSDIRNESENYKKVQRSIRLMHRHFGSLWT